MQHVPQDLGGHDDHGCVRIVRDIAGEQADPIVAESCREVMELLIAQRLDRCGVETRPVRPEGEMGCELAHDRLPGSGGAQTRTSRSFSSARQARIWNSSRAKSSSAANSVSCGPYCVCTCPRYADPLVHAGCVMDHSVSGIDREVCTLVEYV